jgi:hypothetical protein
MSFLEQCIPSLRKIVSWIVEIGSTREMTELTRNPMSWEESNVVAGSPELGETLTSSFYSSCPLPFFRAPAQLLVSHGNRVVQDANMCQSTGSDAPLWFLFRDWFLLLNPAICTLSS